MVTYTKFSPKMVNPRDLAEERRRRRIDEVQTWCDDRYYCAVQFDHGLIDPDLDSRSHECEKAKTSVPIISKSFQSI